MFRISRLIRTLLSVYLQNSQLLSWGTACLPKSSLSYSDRSCDVLLSPPKQLKLQLYQQMISTFVRTRIVRSPFGFILLTKSVTLLRSASTEPSKFKNQPSIFNQQIPCMHKMMLFGFSMCALHILMMSSLVSRAISAVTVEITPGKSTKTIRGKFGPFTVREITSLETVLPSATEFLIRSSISLRSCSKSASLVKSNSRLLSRNCAMWYGPSLKVT